MSSIFSVSELLDRVPPFLALPCCTLHSLGSPDQRASTSLENIPLIRDTEKMPSSEGTSTFFGSLHIMVTNFLSLALEPQIPLGCFM